MDDLISYMGWGSDSQGWDNLLGMYDYSSAPAIDYSSDSNLYGIAPSGALSLIANQDSYYPSLGTSHPSIDDSKETWMNYLDASGDNPYSYDYNFGTTSSADKSLLERLGLSKSTSSLLSDLGSAALIGSDIYERFQSNDLNQDLVKANVGKINAGIKLGDANTYLGYTDHASDQTTKARDNLLLRQYMDQVQPFNREREMAILGKDGVDISKMRTINTSQQAGHDDYIKSLLGYENNFNTYASDLINMRNQDQLYSQLKPMQGALNTIATTTPTIAPVNVPVMNTQQLLSTIPANADPMMVQQYMKFIGAA